MQIETMRLNESSSPIIESEDGFLIVRQHDHTRQPSMQVHTNRQLPDPINPQVSDHNSPRMNNYTTLPTHDFTDPSIHDHNNENIKAKSLVAFSACVLTVLLAVSMHQFVNLGTPGQVVVYMQRTPMKRHSTMPSQPSCPARDVPILLHPVRRWIMMPSLQALQQETPKTRPIVGPTLPSGWYPTRPIRDANSMLMAIKSEPPSVVALNRTRYARWGWDFSREGKCYYPCLVTLGESGGRRGVARRGALQIARCNPAKVESCHVRGIQLL